MRVELRKDTSRHICRIEFDVDDDPLLHVFADEAVVEAVAFSKRDEAWRCSCDAKSIDSDEHVVSLPHCEHFQILGITSATSSDPVRVRARAIRLQARGDFDLYEVLHELTNGED